MIMYIRSIAKVNNFLVVRPGARIICCFGFKRFFLHLLNSHSSLVKNYAFTTYVSSEQAVDGVDCVRKCDIDAVVANVLSVNSGNDVFQSLVNDTGCSTIKINHSLVNKLLHRFQDDWKSALGVFRWVETFSGYKPLPEMYDKLVDILGKMKQLDTMKGLLEKMREDHLVSLDTVAKVMRRFARAGEWKDAVKMFDELDKFGLKKNTDSMNLLLDTLCKMGKVEQARSIFVELKSHIPPNAYSYNIFIHGWCKSKKVEEAQWTLQEMKGNGFRPCVISYSTIINFYCSQRNFSRVYELLDEMEVQNCPPNVVTFTTIVHSFTKTGDFSEALKVAEKMKSVGCKPDTQFYNALIHTLGCAGFVDNALDVFTKEMPQNGLNPNTSTYNTMIAMLCHHKQDERARKYLKSLEISPYCKPDVQSYYPLLKVYFQSRKTDKCLELLDDMVNKHYLCFDLATFTLLIHGLCRADKCKWAYQLFNDMIGQGIKPRYVTCSLLLEEVKQKNMYEAADVVEDYMKRMKSY